MRNKLKASLKFAGKNSKVTCMRLTQTTTENFRNVSRFYENRKIRKSGPTTQYRFKNLLTNFFFERNRSTYLCGFTYI